MKEASKRNDNRPPGEVIADAIYTLEAIQERLDLGKDAIREARRQGLVVKRIGRRLYVRGADLLDWVDRSVKPAA